jgi:hypothetical protein
MMGGVSGAEAGIPMPAGRGQKGNLLSSSDGRDHRADTGSTDVVSVELCAEIRNYP